MACAQINSEMRVHAVRPYKIDPPPVLTANLLRWHSQLPMRGETRHWPFESKYLRDFEVVEECRNGLRLFPHTDQLPLLSKAIHREFEWGLTSRLANADHRADHWRKLQLRGAALAFC